ncbi:hypothetical protein CM19_11320 [Candidatus Acidianus copahuensis]|uniref:Uncharacterized protein n=1 Tax=Candidatus Acidianus copahuensis TaxID=1160895 RepID=A0A031LMC4_9CREN|nr:hypothetical protein [Candidatus Acidianus copahuensis]EZQ02053.1 hypothetical protein CM19_11320 [Candidatus Acidianus copahuensis]
MKLNIDHLAAIVLVAAIVSLGILGGYTHAVPQAIIGTSLLGKYIGGDWNQVYAYSGQGMLSRSTFLQSFGSNSLKFVNFTDSLGDILQVVLVAFPSHSAAVSYAKQNLIGSLISQGKLSIAVYQYGYTEIVQGVYGNEYVMITYIGNTTMPSVSSIEALATALLTGS